jgi:hypothetical protein
MASMLPLDLLWIPSGGFSSGGFSSGGFSFSTTGVNPVRSVKWLDLMHTVYGILNDSTYYNFVVVSLILLSSRIHGTLETPYVLGLLFLFAVRMFIKTFQSMQTMKETQYDGMSSSVKERFFILMQQVILVGDSILLSLLLQAGVVPQFHRQGDADSSLLAFLFTSMQIASGIVLWQSYSQKTLSESNTAAAATSSASVVALHGSDPQKKKRV